MKKMSIALLAVSMLATPSQADQPFYQTIAQCTGRLSAEMEHAWLMNDPAADAFEGQRREFVSILGAVIPIGSGPEVLQTRIEAKFAHERLLNLAAFGTDPERAVWARKRSKYYRERCKNLLLRG